MGLQGGELDQAIDVSTAAAHSASGRTADARARRILPGLYVPGLLLLLCLAAQLYLLFFRSFNWDEFLHYTFLYKIKAGTMTAQLQALHLRMLWWVPEVATHIVDEMRIARLVMWGAHLLTLVMIYGVARKFTTAPNAFFAAFAYLAAGYVFLHGASIRSDPMAAATLMSALFLLARGPLGLVKAIAIGVLIGLAATMTVKSVFYAPCFAGMAWLKMRETPAQREFLAKFVILGLSALAVFAAVYFYFAPEAEAANPVRSVSRLSLFLRWVSEGVPFANYIWKAALLAPLIVVGLVIAPIAWKKAGLKAEQKIALAGLILPLASLFFYRNTFPYFFVFILAPVAVAVAPSLGLLRERYGNAFLAVVLSAIPLALAVMEPRSTLDRQKALIDYVHREFPGKPGYLDYSGMIVDYPRILPYLTSGNGILRYHEQGDAIVGREIDRGNVPFIIANYWVISSALEGRPIPQTFLPADLAAMNGNYVQQWGVLWREGTRIPAGTGPFEFHLRRGGTFTLAGDARTIDGVTVSHGTTVKLERGRHIVSGSRDAPSILWRGDRLPTPPPDLPMDTVFTGF